MAIEPLDIGGKRAVRNMQAKWSGMKEAIMFISYMSTPQKNSAIRKAYVIATKKYRKDLIAKTKATLGNKYPDTRLSAKGKKPTKLWKTVDFKPSKKYDTASDRMVSPLWAGHIVKKGAYHQHFIVRGTKAYKQDGSALQRKKGQRKKLIIFTGKDGMTAYGFKKKAVRGKKYVDPVAKRHKQIILNDFGDSFVKGMRKEARTAKYKRYLSY